MKSKNKKSIKITKKKNEIIISLNPEIYPLEAVYGACYVFIDRAYLFLEGNPEKEIKVFIKGKEGLNSKKLEKIAGEFKNEILNYTLRLSIAKNTRKIRETIVERALFSALPHKEIATEEEEEKAFEEDPLGIAVPWEEKYEKGKKHDH